MFWIKKIKDCLRLKKWNESILDYKFDIGCNVKNEKLKINCNERELKNL